jgi:hypothetical protein
VTIHRSSNHTWSSPSHRRARPAASSHGRTLVHALNQAVSFAPLLESGEHVRACEPNLTAAQPVATGTLSSRASFLPRRASAEPTRVRVRSQARERIQPHRRRPPQPRRRNLLLCSARRAGLRRCRAKNPTKAASFPCPNRALRFGCPCLRAC